MAKATAVVSALPRLPPPPLLSLNFPNYTLVISVCKSAMLLIPSVPYLDSAFDLATVALIGAVLLLSLVSLLFIFHLRLRSRTSHQLQNFNALWTVRLLLVLFIILWAVNEVLRIPLLRRQFPYPFLPSMTVAQQANLCRVHVVLSLGVYEPGFLITLLFLVNVSVKARSKDSMWGVIIVFAFCLPIFLLQLFFTCFFSPDFSLPGFFLRSSVDVTDDYGNDAVLCAYPFLNIAVFAAFGFVYALCFLLSCWRVVSLVINKGLRVRIYALVSAVMFTLLAQLIFLGISVFLLPEDTVYSFAVLMVFLSVLSCAVVGQGILVIRPIYDALSAGGESCRWVPGLQPGKQLADECQ